MRHRCAGYDTFERHSSNAVLLRAQSLPIACYNACVQLHNIIAASIYRAHDALWSCRGNKVRVGINVLATFLFSVHQTLLHI